jgi:rhomboid protease GluP
MAIGFTPKHREEIPVGELTQDQFLMIAVDTAEKMDWRISYLSDNGFIAYTNNGMFVWGAEVKLKIEHGLAEITSASVGNEFFDLGKNKDVVETFMSNFEKLKAYWTKEELQEKLEALKEKIVPDKDDILKLPPPTTSQQVSGFFSIFKPTRGFFITPILMDLNIIIFIIMAICGVGLFSPSGEDLINWGANLRPLTIEGQWWRLITCCFLHIGIIHLLLNMYALMYIGILLEPYLGKTRFLSAYLLTGLAASMASLWWHEQTISAGASGAIFGMYGVFLAMLTTDLIEKNARKSLLASIVVFVGYNLLSGLKGEVDNAAHIGGLISGIIIGYAFIPSLKNEDNKNLKRYTVGCLTILTLVSCFFIYNSFSNDTAAYLEKMKTFTTNESMALEVYKLSSDKTPKEDLLREIKDRGIYYWEENLKLIADADKLNIPERAHIVNQKLKTYCELRIKSYWLNYKAIEEGTDKHNAEIAAYDDQIKALIDGMKDQQ